MCFKTPKAPALPPPDPAVEFAKIRQSEESIARIAEEKEEDTKRQRGLIYGLFGPRSLIAGAGPGGVTSQLRPVGT